MNAAAALSDKTDSRDLITGDVRNKTRKKCGESVDVLYLV